MDVEYELVKWFVKEKLPSDVVRYDGILSLPQGYRFYGSYFDLFVETKNEFWIVEAERNSSDTTIYKALGQLLFYKHLWNSYNENAGEKQLKLICLCPYECSDDASKFLAGYGIEFVKGNVQR